jgi:hypothetical protein
MLKASSNRELQRIHCAIGAQPAGVLQFSLQMYGLGRTPVTIWTFPCRQRSQIHRHFLRLQYSVCIDNFTPDGGAGRQQAGAFPSLCSGCQAKETSRHL